MDLSNVLKPGMKGVFYGRHSTKKQTMDTQKRRAYELAEKYGCEIIYDILDAGVSSRKKDRKGYKRLISDAYANIFDFVVIDNHERIARIPEDHDIIRLSMDILNIPIVVSETESLYNSGDTIYTSVKDGIAKYELDKIRSNTRNALESLAIRGKWTGGKAPFGYRYMPKGKDDIGRFEIVDVEMKLVKDVFELYKKNHGFTTIANKMPPNSHRGKAWNKDRVKNIITNPFYAGYISIRRKVDNKHNAVAPRSTWIMEKSPMIPSVISIEEWEQLWNLYKAKSERKIPPKHFKTSFLLSGLLKCKHCNDILIGKDQRSKSSKGKVYGNQVYICNTCGYKIIADKTHNTALNVLKGYHGIDIEKMVAAVQVTVENQINLLTMENEDLEIVLEKEKVKLSNCEKEIEIAFKEKETKKAIIKVLTIAKERLMNKIQQTQQAIQLNSAKIELLQNVDKSEELIKEQLKSFPTSLSLLNDDLRALFLYLFEEIIVNNSGHMNCKVRFDLDDV